MTEQRYPLSWPTNWPRTQSHVRKYAQFGKTVDNGNWKSKASLSIADGTKRLMDELNRLGARDVILSTNLKVGKQGYPLSDQSEPKDSGVAVYFKLLGKNQVLACDKWTRTADNMAAIAAHIDAIRRQERYGVGTMAQAFAGYEALPDYSAGRHWSEILGVSRDADLDEIADAYRTKAKTAHPDNGGTSDGMAEINRAYREAKTERGTA